MIVLKRILCTVLAVIMLTSVVTVAADDAKCNCGVEPVVFVSGIGTPLYLNAGTAEETPGFIPEISDMLPDIIDAIPGLAEAVVKRNWDLATDTFIDVFTDIFEVSKCDENGDSAYNVTGEVSVVDIEKNHTESPEYYFTYDWRLDPSIIADELNTYIEDVKTATGHDKINVLGFSEGGLIATTYLKKYGTASLNQLSICFSAFQGLELVGELFNGNISLDSKNTAKCIDSLLANGDASVIGSIALALYKAGVLDTVLGLLDELFEHSQDRLYDELLIPMVGYWPVLWAFVPDEYYESAKVSMLGNDPKYDTLINRIDWYHYNVQTKAKELLDGALADGVKLSFVCGYNLNAMPFTPDANYQSDGLINTEYESGGAICMEHGSTLTDDYVSAANDGHNHISPDRIIDASTCMFPDYTWFIKDHSHFSFNYEELVKRIFASDKQFTVYDDPDYPQFLKCVGSELEVLEDDGENENNEITWLSIIYNFVLRVIKLIKSFFIK